MKEDSRPSGTTKGQEGRCSRCGWWWGGPAATLPSQVSCEEPKLKEYLQILYKC